MKKILICLLIISFSLIGISQTSWFKKTVHDFVVQKIEENTGMTATLAEIDYHFPLRVSAHNFTLGDPNDPVATIADFDANASFLALFTKEIKLKKLNLNHVLIHHPFSLPEIPKKGDEPLEIPVACSINHFEVNDLVLAPVLPSINLEGNIKGAGSEIAAVLRVMVSTFCIDSKISYSEASGLDLYLIQKQFGSIDLGGKIDVPPDAEGTDALYDVQLHDLEFLKQWYKT